MLVAQRSREQLAFEYGQVELVKYWEGGKGRV